MVSEEEDIDMSVAYAPKSDQLNADDLIGGPITIRISRVKKMRDEKQPTAIYFDGDNGKPWKPCKFTARCLMEAWGSKASNYVGRKVTLYRDPEVEYGASKVGGIRISHASDLPAPSITFPVTAKRGVRVMVTVKNLGDSGRVDRRPESPGNLESALKAIESSAPEAIEALKVTLRETAWSRDSSAKIAAAFKARG